MRLIAFALAFIVLPQCIAQSIEFVQVAAPLPAPQNIANLEGVFQSSIDTLDANGDGHLDLLVFGRNNFDTPIAYLYENQGDGSMIRQMDALFTPVGFAVSAVFDANGDGWIDVLSGGLDANNTGVLSLYLNNGMGEFSSAAAGLPAGLYTGTIAVGDIDSDGDQDVFISGSTDGPVGYFAGLFINDGTGFFEEDVNQSFVALLDGHAAFIDVNGDLAPDLIGCGDSVDGERMLIYTNDGSGNLTTLPVGEFDGIRYGNFVADDFDNDGDNDLIYSGQGVTGERIVRRLINDGTGVFDPVDTTPFQAAAFGELLYADFDGDGDLDVAQTGASATGDEFTSVYLNDGIGGFSTVTESNIGSFVFGASAAGDLTGDGIIDLVYTGQVAAGYLESMLFVGEGDGSFKAARGTAFIGSEFTALGYADVDGDGDIDVVHSGQDNTDQAFTQLLLNDGDGYYTQQTTSVLAPLTRGSAAFADADGDGDADLVLTGELAPFNRVTQLYLNNGSGSFAIDLSTDLTGVREGGLVFDDLDGDGDNDIFITGMQNDNARVAAFYRNDGAGSFTLDTGSAFVAVRYGNAISVDIDGDGDKDLLYCGEFASAQQVTLLYLNDGSGMFTDAEANFTGVRRGMVACNDANGDGMMDVLVCGIASTVNQYTALFLQTEAGEFVAQPEIDLVQTQNCIALFTDLTADGHPDIWLSGISTFSSTVSVMYENDGEGGFNTVDANEFPALRFAAAISLDIDNDGDQDVLYSGQADDAISISRLMRNQACSIQEDVVTACGSFTWYDGITYTESTSGPFFSVPGGTVNGCDSVLVLNLTIVGAIDECGICFEDGLANPEWNQSCLDCNGQLNGAAFIDACGQCVGGETGLSACALCAADVSDDGLVNIEDLSQFLADFGCTLNCLSDFNNDGLVDVYDLSLFLQAFGEICD